MLHARGGMTMAALCAMQPRLEKIGLKMFYVFGLLGFCTKTGHENT